jgi:hypothetical protein
MATVAVLNTLVTANTNPFSKAMGGVSKTLGSVSLSMGSLVKVASGIGAAFAAFAGVRAGIQGVSEAMERIDKLAKDSERMGVTVEQLQSLRHASELAGVSVDALTPAFGRMSRTIVDAANGSDTAQAALQTLGLSATTLLSQSPDSAFKAIANSISAIEHPTLRAAAAQGIFGKGAAELLPLLNGGAAAVESANRQLDQFGALLSGVDAAQVEAANDSFGNVKKIVDAINESIAVNLAPFLEEIAIRAQRFAIEGGGAGTIVSAAFEGVAVSIAQSMRVIDLLMGAWHALRTVVAGVIGFVIKAIGLMAQEMIAALNMIPGVAITFNSSILTVGDAMLDVASKAAEDSVAAFESAFTGSRVEAVKGFFDDVQEKARLAAEAVEAQRAKLRTVSATALSVESDVSDVADAVKNVDLSVSTLEDMPKAVAKATAFEDRSFGVTSRDSFAGARAEQGFGTFLNDKGEDKKIEANTKKAAESLKKMEARQPFIWVQAAL